WWEENMKDSLKHVPKENERRPGQATEVRIGNNESPDSQETNTSSVAIEDSIEEEGRTDNTHLEGEPTNSSTAGDPFDAGNYDKVVTGKITSLEDGSPLPGVNVLVRGTTRGTISDINGDYKLAMNNDEALVISFIGYVTSEVAPNGRSVVGVSLSEDMQQLSEVVVTGMGEEVRRKSLSYSISTITTSLAGKVAGVNISNASGGTVVVRGNSTVTVGDEPMYLI